MVPDPMSLLEDFLNTPFLLIWIIGVCFLLYVSWQNVKLWIWHKVPVSFHKVFFLASLAGWLIVSPVILLRINDFFLGSLCFAGVLLLCAFIDRKMERRVFYRTLLKVFRELDRYCSSTSDLIATTPEQFPMVDRDFYDETEARFSRLGARTWGDFETRHWNRAFPRRISFIRQLHLDHGTIQIGLFHVLERTRFGKTLLDRKQIVLITEWLDGTFLETNNLDGILMLSPEKGRTKLQLPPDTEPEELLRVHREGIALLVENDLQPLSIDSLVSLFEHERRNFEHLSADRRAKGIFTEEEFAAMIGSGENYATHPFFELFRKAKARFQDNAHE